ncbi:hypothetical protein [Burkholderia plantarii]|uniref:hypothetical protein n=1 Tax=Burkholderia plantarii TaxID=41899 RepID=UPI0007065692|nr:hypothetical protein [Burkholderia plantarii]ALK33360.1 hypothetical protein bpln_2g11190 [Burkholderia plantarii]GLZ16519.1 hypothetical protein Bpla01_00490 [Burkholderia plantarii]
MHPVPSPAPRRRSFRLPGLLVPALAAAALLSACAGGAPRELPPPPSPPIPAGMTGAQLLPRGYVCQDCAIDFLLGAITPPAHGLMLVRGGFMTPQAIWIVVDYDARRVSRIVTAASQDARGRFALRALARNDGPLSTGELSGIRSDADAIWISTHTLRSKSAADTTWSLYLIDGGAVRHEFGIGQPGEGAARLADDLDGIVRHAIGG